MTTPKCKFAVLFGNRGFFPAKLISGARTDMLSALSSQGHEAVILDESATRYGAVEGTADGKVFASLVTEHRSDLDGIIVCLPNFGDETGVVAAVKDAGLPILIQAYPDELKRLGPADRRDAFCGKFSVMDVLHQYGVPFTAPAPHVCHPSSATFATQLDTFARTCKVVKGLKRLTVGAIGARTTAFKTVRIDEVALQQQGITVETFDLSDVFARMRAMDLADARVQQKQTFLEGYSRMNCVPSEARLNLSRLSVALDEIIEENRLDAIALRCWIEIQKEFKISPCVLLSELNNRFVTAACELDVGNAVAMEALKLAASQPAACLDWNNNFGAEPDKCILFHCGPVPQALMVEQGEVVDHSILANSLGPNCSHGCNVGRIAPTPMTYASLMTEDGRLKFYLGEGRFTDDQIPGEFFGCAGVAEIPNLADVLHTVGMQGYRHHVSVTPGHVSASLNEAFTRYLDVDHIMF